MILLYIDPGTGSMLFTIFISIVSSLFFVWKKFALKAKFLLSGGRGEATEERYPYVIFSDSKRYWNLFAPICDEFERRGLDLEYLTASEDDPALSCEYKHVHCRFIGENNKAFAKLNLLNADILLSTTPGLDVYQWKRSKNVQYYIHAFHTVDEGTAYRMFGIDYYDAILLTGEFQEYYIRKLETLRGLPQKELEVVGSTYMDALKRKLEESGAAARKEKKTILLAPSWGESGILYRYGEEIINELVKTGYEIIIRPHPQSFISEKPMMDRLRKQFPETENLKWNRDNDNFEVLKRADLLITDFSGIIFDFALVFGKPLIYADTSFDSAPYDAAWIDEPLWRFEVLKDLGVQLKKEDFPKLKQLIDEQLLSAGKAQAREKVRDEAWQYIGESAERTVDYMVRKYREVSAKRA